MVTRVDTAQLPTAYGTFTVYAYQDGKQEHLALVKGDLKNCTPLVRIHSRCITGDVFSSLRCDCHSQLHQSLKKIQEAPCGVLVYLDQEGRGIGLANKIKAYALQDKGKDTVEANVDLGFEADERSFGVAVDILADLGITKIKLLTNNPEKLSAFDKTSIEVERIPCAAPFDVHTFKYLSTKKEKMGHLLQLDYMHHALELATHADPRPNPNVGCVIVQNGHVIGEGFHAKAGEPHAEIVALKQAGAKAKGATMYVTLEPCTHHGKTPPCTDAIIAAGIKNVIVAVRDPNPISGDGIAQLQNAGIAVDVLDLPEAYSINNKFFTFVTKKLPYTTIKAAMSFDGKICTKTGDSQWISNEESRVYAHQLRAEHAAVLVGSETVLRDNPQLTVRHVKGKNPLRVVVDSHLKVPLDSHVFDDTHVVLATIIDDKEKIKKYEEKNIEVIQTKPKNDHVDLHELFAELAKRGVMSVLVEGGGTMIASIIESHLADHAVFVLAPKIIGGVDAKTPVEGEGVELIKDAYKLENIKIKRFGDDIMVEGDFS